MLSKFFFAGACIVLICLVLITASLFWDTFRTDIRNAKYRKCDNEQVQGANCYYDCYVDCTIVDKVDVK